MARLARIVVPGLPHHVTQRAMVMAIAESGSEKITAALDENRPVKVHREEDGTNVPF